MTNDDRGAYLALVIAAFATLEPQTRPFTIFFVAILPLVLLAYGRIGRPSVVVAYVVGGGLINRLDTFPAGGWTNYSDSLRVASEATATMLAGGNPYDHQYLYSVAPYTTTVYSPPMFLIHAPGQWLLGLSGAMLTQIAGAAVVMAVLVWLASRTSWAIGLPIVALYSCLPFLVFLTTNGTNDMAVGAAILVGAMVLWRALRDPSTPNLVFAGVALAITFGAKQFAWPVAIVLLIHAGRQIGWRAAARIAVAGAATFLAVSVPFIAMNPVRFVEAMLHDLVVRKEIFGWNVWSAVQSAGLALPAETLVLTVGATLGALVVACMIRYRNYGEAVLGAISVALVLLFTTRWTSASYLPLFAALALATPMLSALPSRPAERTEPRSVDREPTSA